MRLVLVSRNPNKLRELRAALPAWEIELLETADEPVEDGATFLDNARIKARHGRSRARREDWVAGEDSGIEVKALGGAPGVQSARWADDGVARLVAELGDRDDREARYVCELVVLAPDGSETRATGTLEGSIALEPRGDEGFGYDPIFVPTGESRTVAELGNVWKATHSHRARAARALADALGARVVASARMDAAQALAELMELSSQVERAVVLDSTGATVASAGDGAEALAAAAREAIEAAAALHAAEGGVTAVEVELADGALFVLAEGGTTIAATTGPEPSGGLVAYDLRTCLARIDEKPKRRRAKKSEEGT